MEKEQRNRKKRDEERRNTKDVTEPQKEKIARNPIVAFRNLEKD